MSIYHLHIPRTGGVSVREQLVNRLNNKFSGHRQQLPETFLGFKYVSGHFATNPIKDLDLNFAVVRDPVSLTFSYINYMRQNFYSNYSFDEMMAFYQEKDGLSAFANVNIKFLTGTINTGAYNENIKDLKKMAESGWFVEDYETDVLKALETVKTNKTLTIDINNPDRHSFLCDLYNNQVPNIKTNESRHVDPSVYKKHEKTVKLLNELDLEFYDQLEK